MTLSEVKKIERRLYKVRTERGWNANMKRLKDALNTVRDEETYEYILKVIRDVYNPN